MHIYGPANVHSTPAVGASEAVRRTPPQTAPSGGGQIQDQLDLSDAAQMLDQLGDIPDIRHDRVAALRAQIASGTYETPEKLSLALERMLDEIG